MAKKDQTDAASEGLSREEVIKLATAIGRANNHSQPEDWAARVADAYAPPPEHPEDAAEGEKE